MPVIRRALEQRLAKQHAFVKEAVARAAAVSARGAVNLDKAAAGAAGATGADAACAAGNVAAAAVPPELTSSTASQPPPLPEAAAQDHAAAASPAQTATSPPATGKSKQRKTRHKGAHGQLVHSPRASEPTASAAHGPVSAPAVSASEVSTSATEADVIGTLSTLQLAPAVPVGDPAAEASSAAEALQLQAGHSHGAAAAQQAAPSQRSPQPRQVALAPAQADGQQAVDAAAAELLFAVQVARQADSPQQLPPSSQATEPQPHPLPPADDRPLPERMASAGPAVPQKPRRPTRGPDETEAQAAARSAAQFARQHLSTARNSCPPSVPVFDASMCCVERIYVMGQWSDVTMSSCR